MRRFHIDPVEVRLFHIGVFVTALKRHRAARAFCRAVSIHTACRLRRGMMLLRSAALLGRHLRALLFQNRLA